MAYEISRFETTAALLSGTVAAWEKWILERAPGRRPPTVALAGGRVFRAFLEASARRLQVHRTRLEPLEFFWGDERCVPPGDPESNYLLARDSFLGPLGIARERIHRLRGEVEPQAAATAAEVILRSVTGCGTPATPALDLVFLGMGEDGHVASLFPGAPPEVTESAAVYLPVTGPKPPPQRITLSHRMLAAAHEVWVMASGPGKEQALRESLRPGGGTPLARVLRERASTRLFTDLRV